MPTARLPDRQLQTMPLGFGCAGGPRQGVDDLAFRHGPTRFLRHAVSFLTEEASLKALLPPGLGVAGEPVVTVQFVKLTEIPWLAGRG